MSWWDAAYRHGSVNWDPGPYDLHLERMVDLFGIAPGVALDIGCGTGKASVWLARRGFRVIGIDIAESAVEQARGAAVRAGVDRADGRAGSARFAVARFPDDVGPGRRVEIPTASVDLVVERATLQHIGGHGATSVPIENIAALLRSGGYFYSLMIAGDGIPRGWGMGRWNKAEIGSMMEPFFRILHLERTVFTPGERGSVPAWLSVMQKDD